MLLYLALCRILKKSILMSSILNVFIISIYCRCAIVGCYMTEDYFLEREGVFLLIDLLEVKNLKQIRLLAF